MTSSNASKQKKAYLRKLYIAHLIDTERQDLRSLEEVTGMPRRTLQDSIKAMSDIGIDCCFVQDGPKHRHGYYRIVAWGDHDQVWIKTNLNAILAVLR